MYNVFFNLHLKASAGHSFPQDDVTHYRTLILPEHTLVLLMDKKITFGLISKTCILHLTASKDRKTVSKLQYQHSQKCNKNEHGTVFDT